MEQERYQALWDLLSPEMQGCLERMREILAAQLGPSRFELSPVSLETDCDDFFALLTVCDKADPSTVLLSLDYALVANEDESDTCNVRLQVTDVRAQNVLLSYIPNCYSADVFVHDPEVLRVRILLTTEFAFSVATAKALSEMNAATA